MNVSDKDIDVVKRLSLVEKKNGAKVSQPMKQYYAQFEFFTRPIFKVYKSNVIQKQSESRLVICLRNPVTGST